ncbi:hypothetical protein RZO50_07050 [Microbacterium sp. SSW1-59]|uniref:hypothetical protein n=1 Tax=Microbacterium xanthum TaxID=3079794 RepID=UPI002AD57FFE|nr:hypothetical protein [Microbacterium sp. SSW1-59]MDZ8201265.1 hypothetical protein [Microbacterium sp. SSW1-59]
MSSKTAVNRFRRVAAPLAVAIVIGVPNVTVIALGIEDYPFTAAPMFAHYVDLDSELYSFRLESHFEGVSEEFPLAETNRGNREVMRQLVAKFYRPLSPTSPLRDPRGTMDAEMLENAMVQFFKPLVDHLAERGIHYDSIDLLVDKRTASGEVEETRRVGYYLPCKEIYVHTYGEAQ